jgi:peptide/nickel transport system permease protein
VLLVGLVVVFALLSLVSPVDTSLIYVAIPDQPPSPQYWFGTNSRGQDLFWQLSAAFRNSIMFGITVAVLSRVISIAVGLASGYIGGWVDRALMFVNDIFVAVPIFPVLVLFYFVLRNNMDSLRWR